MGAASILASMQGEVGRGDALGRKAGALAEQSCDLAGRVWGLMMLSFADRCRGDHEKAAAHAEAAVKEAQTLDDDLPHLPQAGHKLAQRGDAFRHRTEPRLTFSLLVPFAKTKYLQVNIESPQLLADAGHAKQPPSTRQLSRRIAWASESP
jgi:hypothetical protein